MKLLLVVANRHAQSEPSIGVAYIAAYLIKYLGNIEIKILQYIPKDISVIKDFSPDIIGISSIVIQYYTAVEYAKEIKKEFNIPVIIGGPQITCMPKFLDKIFDVGIMGEGEQTMLELMQLYQKDKEFNKNKLKNINGLVFYENDKLIITASRGLIEPLDKIPKPARHLLDMEFHLKDKYVFGRSYGRGTHIMTIRGCHFKCLFCSISNLWKRLRYNSAERVIDEIKELIDVYNVKLIHIYDTLFPVNRSRLRKVTELIEKEGISKKAKIGLFCRVDLIDDEICSLLKRMGVIHIDFGIESGNQRILDLLNKKITIKQIESAVFLCKKYGFSVGGTVMIGSPTETEEEMLNTLAFIKKLKLDKFYFYTVTPFPGTPLYDYCVEHDLLPKELNLESFKQQTNIDTPFKKMKVEDISSNQQILLTKEVSPQKYVEIYNKFVDEKMKLYSSKEAT